jgi:hypothetical protein
MTRHTAPPGRFGPSDCSPADNRPRSDLNCQGALAEDILREMAFVFHVVRSVNASMTRREGWVAATPE